MKLILATDAIFPPLTGIGRYASELASRLPLHPAIDEVRYFGMWRWQGGGLKGAGAAAVTLPAVPPWLARLRREFADRRWAVSAYDLIGERWRARLLRQAGRDDVPAVYHSPNFFLPHYDGPAVVTVHDLSIDRFPETHQPAQRHYFDLAFARSLARAQRVITVSATVRDELIAAYGLAPEQVVAVLHGVDACFQPRPAAALQAVLARYQLQPGGYLLSVSTLEPRKRLEQLIAAHARLPAAVRTRWPLVLVGARGWLNQRLQKTIEAGEQGGWLRYLGYVDQTELPLLYAGARAFAMVSIYEGFGLPLLEAMASGVPVLTSNRSCMPEVSAGAALLVDPDDVDAIAGALGQLLDDQAWRAAAIERGLARAAELSWERCIDATVEVYRQAAAA